MKNEKILVSFIIPVYNEEKRIKACLDSIYSQKFSGKTEVLIIDDDSTDKTLEIARKYPVKILKNGKKDYEIGKAIGANNAGGKYLVFIDADNRLIDKNWLEKGVRVLEGNKKVLGVQSWKFFYSRSHNSATRYTDLFGNMDPFVFYLKSQDHLRSYEKSWKLAGEIIEENKEQVIVKFSKNIPTLGSQGFLTRKEYFEKLEKIQHIEQTIKIIREKGLLFCFLKNDVEHLAVANVRYILKKFARNAEYALKDKEKGQLKRYELSFIRIIKIIFILETLAIPLYDSVKGYIRIRDSAWFLHVFLCFIIPWIYGFKFISSFFRT